MTQETIKQTLADAGCAQETIAAFLKASKAGQESESIRLLRQHRGKLLDNLHKEQKKLDCLDYLLYELKRAAEGRE